MGDRPKGNAMAECYGRCGLEQADDDRPWLLITGWRISPLSKARRTAVAYLLCLDCEDGHAYLADELDDLMGVRLPDNSADSLTAALRGWPTFPVGRS
jgi:hypothetical protein